MSKSHIDELEASCVYAHSVDTETCIHCEIPQPVMACVAEAQPCYFIFRVAAIHG